MKSFISYPISLPFLHRNFFPISSLLLLELLSQFEAWQPMFPRHSFPLRHYMFFLSFNYFLDKSSLMMKLHDRFFVKGWQNLSAHQIQLSSAVPEPLHRTKMLNSELIRSWTAVRVLHMQMNMEMRTRRCDTIQDHWCSGTSLSQYASFRLATQQSLHQRQNKSCYFHYYSSGAIICTMTNKACPSITQIPAYIRWMSAYAHSLLCPYTVRHNRVYECILHLAE